MPHLMSLDLRNCPFVLPVKSFVLSNSLLSCIVFVFCGKSVCTKYSVVGCTHFSGFLGVPQYLSCVCMFASVPVLKFLPSSAFSTFVSIFSAYHRFGDLRTKRTTANFSVCKQMVTAITIMLPLHRKWLLAFRKVKS